MNKFYSGSVVVVTGGASGIGKAIVKQIVTSGAQVVIVGRTKRTGRQVVKEFAGDGHDVAFEHVDMTHTKDVQKMFERIQKKYGRIDYFFNNAGIFLGGEMHDTPIENWHTVTENNIASTMNGSYYAYQLMVEQGFGHIVNVASAAGLFPVPIMGIYGATKFAIVGLTRSLRYEAKAYGVKVSIACPTVVNTPLYDTAKYNNFDPSTLLKSRDTLQSPEAAARKIVRGVLKNKAVIHTSVATHAVSIIYRLSPPLYAFGAQRIVTLYRSKLRQDV